mmetsp:Transcript_41015/g.97450  ORF Transcript_41015/g.97450 Transcript_41015/m.97450 type:complete len:258 (+) Transcript_41015:133-906(+)
MRRRSRGRRLGSPPGPTPSAPTPPPWGRLAVGAACPSGAAAEAQASPRRARGRSRPNRPSALSDTPRIARSSWRPRPPGRQNLKRRSAGSESSPRRGAAQARGRCRGSPRAGRCARVAGCGPGGAASCAGAAWRTSRGRAGRGGSSCCGADPPSARRSWASSRATRSIYIPSSPTSRGSSCGSASSWSAPRTRRSPAPSRCAAQRGRRRPSFRHRRLARSRTRSAAQSQASGAWTQSTAPSAGRFRGRLGSPSPTTP